MKPEIIQACTPGFLALIGLFIGLAAMLAPSISETARSSGINLALAAIASAGGLARGGSSDSTNVKGDRVQIDSIQNNPSEK
ncbi:hypothetical protein [Nostoc sp.]|uniref:hypothetical protein n=1 Tax=Nostoc sp. TaxID=1180 RepID=UPI002FF54258